MRFALAAVLLGFVTGCATNDPKLVSTQVVTFPDGALVEYNGEPVGRAPSRIVLPQDEEGRLTERAVVRVIPNSEQHSLYAQTRVFDPAERTDPVPNRIMVDMTQRGTNIADTLPPRRETTHVEKQSDTSPRKVVPYVDRGKPTQAVGLDRWNPGKY